MNILPKKSWHVRNKDNVEKVRKDEENARIEAKEQSQRAALAEQEARTNYLRDKARSRALESSDDLKELLQFKNGSESGNVLSRAFTHAGASSQSQVVPSSLKNEENEREKKDEQVKYEKKIGLLTYLGQSAAETMEDCDKPWYFKPPSKRRNRKSSSSEDETNEKDVKRKASLDPMQSMKSHLQKKKLADEHSKKHKKHKRKHKRHKSGIEEEVTPRLSGCDKLAKLREERLKREKKERERTTALFNGGETNVVEEKPGRYNSQYNPHLARVKTYSHDRRHHY